jgi:hypothetical protein
MRMTLKRREVFAAIRQHMTGKWIQPADKWTVSVHLTALWAKENTSSITFLT